MSYQVPAEDIVDYFLDHLMLAVTIQVKAHGRDITPDELQQIQVAQQEAKDALVLAILPFEPDDNPLLQKMRKSA